MPEQTTNRRPGRPRDFDRHDALHSAMLLFWQKGYEGASLAELLSVMKIKNKPSLYNSFGNKQQLFEQVLEHYLAGPVRFIHDAWQQPDISAALSAFFTGAAQALTAQPDAKGCMVIQGALSCSDDAAEVKALLIKARQRYEHMIAQRLEQAVEAGQLSAETDSVVLAKYIVSLHQGMSVQATSGATQAQLQNLAELAVAMIVERHRLTA